MKQSLLLTLFGIVIISTIDAQDFDKQLEKLAEGIAAKLNGKEKNKVAVWGFVTESGERTALGNYLTEDFSVYITNFSDKFEIIDRNHLDMLLKEHQLNSEGYIDEKTAKQLGKIIAVDAIITGTYTVLNSTIKIRAKVLDSETALQFAAKMTSLPINKDIASYLGISVNGSNTTNKGFNTPLSSNETINNPKTVDPRCKEEKYGDFCFYNSLDKKIVLKINYYTSLERSSSSNKIMTLNPEETKCFYRIHSRPMKYYVATWDVFQKELGGYTYKITEANLKHLKDIGEVKVETCKSKTFTIR